MSNRTIKRITSCIIVLTLFSSFVAIPSETIAAGGLNWNSPNKNNAFKLDASAILNAGTLTAIVGCTGIIDEIVGAGLQLVGQISNSLLGTSVQVNDAASVAQQKVDSKREACLNGIAYSLARQQLVSMTKSTMNWVNSGFNGDPMYVRNITSLTDSIGKEILNSELDMFKNPEMNAMYPYGANFAQTEIRAYKSLHSTDSLQQDLTSYLSDGSTIQSFASDFSQGGWGGWLALTQKDANNPLGYTMNKSQQIADKQNTQIEATKAEVDRNGGMLDQKKCVKYAISTTAGANQIAKEITAGATAKDYFASTSGDYEGAQNALLDAGDAYDASQAKKAKLDAVKTTKAAYDNADANYKKMLDAYIKAQAKRAGTNIVITNEEKAKQQAEDKQKSTYDAWMAAKDAAEGVTFDAAADKVLKTKLDAAQAAFDKIAKTDSKYVPAVQQANTNSECTQWEVITPGSLIKDKITKTLSSPETQLELADSLNEVLYSIFSNLMNKFQNNGLASLSSSAFGSVSDDIGSNSILDANGNAIKNVNEDSGLDASSGFDITKDLGSESEMCLDDFPNGLGADKKTCGIIETQKEYLNTVTKLFAPLSNVMYKLGALDYCIPGPNPGWETNSGAKDAYVEYLNGINFVGGTELGRDSDRYYVTVSGSKTIAMDKGQMDPDSPTWQNYMATINNSLTNWNLLRQTWYLDLFSGYDISRKSQADTWAIITAKTDPRLDEIEKTQAEYKRNADVLYGPNSSMQTELLDDGTTIRENPEYLPMAQAGLNITKDIASYGQKTVDMVQTYQDRTVETRANLYKLQKISDKVNAIVKRAQAARDAARAQNGEPPISPECKANEKVNIGN